MAQAKFIDSDDFEMTISNAIAKYPEIAEKCLAAGAGIIADEMKRRLKGVLSPFATGQLVGAFGITPVKRDLDGNFNVHLGFDGYQQPPQKRFPSGVPFQLIARSFESGAVVGKRAKRGKLSENETYWRTPMPFAAPAVRATRARAFEEMKRVAETELEKLDRR